MPSAVDKLAADAETATTTVAVPLGADEHEVEVLPIADWRSSGIRALREGDFTTWAETCLSEDGLAVWDDVDPTVAEVEAFFDAWSKRTGQDPGKSRASRRSSRSTARR